MRNLLGILKLVSKDDVPDGTITLLINKIVSNHKELPAKIHRDLKFNIATFLVFYPLGDKQKTIYNKLIGDKAKLGYLLRYAIGEANKIKIDTSAHHRIKSENAYNHHMFKYYNDKESSLEIPTDVLRKQLTDMYQYYGGSKSTTSLLTAETINILVKLIKKRAFLLKNPTFLT